MYNSIADAYVLTFVYENNNKTFFHQITTAIAASSPSHCGLTSLARLAPRFSRSSLLSRVRCSLAFAALLCPASDRYSACPLGAPRLYTFSSSGGAGPDTVTWPPPGPGPYPERPRAPLAQLGRRRYFHADRTVRRSRSRYRSFVCRPAVIPRHGSTQAP